MLDAGSMTPLQKAVVALKTLRARNAELEQAATAPIAIIGMGCRFPAEAISPSTLWAAVAGGRDGSGEVPAERWNIDEVYDPEPGQPGKMYTRKSCFLGPVDGFDPLFFRISPREAVGIDPQQRLLLEVTWEALENAGIAASSLVGSPTGVFVGISTNDYSALLSRTAHGSGSNATAGAGNAASIASGRIAYTFGFQGPCFAVDTACSSSLVATHLAVQSLRARESRLAIVAGVNLMLTPDITINFCQGRMLSPDGRCKTFDAAADGYVRGEGCGVLVLKRLSDALAEGDPVLAVIRGSATNQDGRSAGLTAPNGLAQEAVIRKALENARLTPDEVDFIEAHGTGTALGDPIEMHALKAVFAERSRPLHVGSVKTNIGHCEAAAGVAGLIKSVLMLQHQALPPSLHFSRLNPHIELGGVDIRVPTELTAAPVTRIGVSSFGFSGTNVHIVLERAPPASPIERPEAATRPRLFLSARSRGALQAVIDQMRNHLAQTTDSVADICHTAAVGRVRFPWWVCVDHPAELGLATPSNDPPPAVPPPTGRKVALPTYPFERQRCWIDAPAPVAAQAPAPSAPQPGQHPLLGRELALPLASERRWEAVIAPGSPQTAFLLEHEVAGRPVLPAAALVEMALAAVDTQALAELEIPAPLELANAADRRVQTILTSDGTVRIVSYTDDAQDADVVTHLSARRATPSAGSAWPCAPAGAAIDDATFYAGLTAVGVGYGPSFRLLCNIRGEPGSATAGLLPAVSGGPYRIHPARLDAAFQLVAAALPLGPGELLVPAGMARVLLHRTPAQEAQVEVRATRDAEGVRADVRIVDGAGIALEVDGLLFRPAAGMAAANEGSYTLAWRAQPLLQGIAEPLFLPAPASLDRTLTTAAAALAARHDMAAYASANGGLERIATGHVVRALEALGMRFQPGVEATIGALTESLGIAPRHQRLFARCLQMLEADGILARQQRRWRVLATPQAADPEAEARALASRYPDMAGEIAVLQRCGGRLAPVLTGEVEPLGLLFPADGQSEGAATFYSGSAYARTVNGLLASAAAALATSAPCGRPLRILEVGAGTGGATEAILEAVPAAQRAYVFTDIAASFLTAASRKFAAAKLTTGLLDIERPPAEQGFAGGSFDVVLAANVLHATADLAQSLAHIRELLAPGGYLLLVESTARRRWVDIVFGLTEGWWRFTDQALRPDHPLLELDQWRELLARCGFTTSGGSAAEVIIARRPPEASIGPLSSWHLLGDAGGLAEALAGAGQVIAPPEEAAHWVHVLDPVAADEVAQCRLMGELVELVGLARRQSPPPALTLVADDTLGHAGVAGFMRTAALEVPELRPRLIIAPPSGDALLDELASPRNEPEIGWDASGRRQVRRLAAAAPAPAAPPIRGAWLVTGGRGGVGRALAGWLAGQGATQIILLSREPAPPLPGIDVPVRVYAGDAADGELLARILAEHAPVQGIVHAAGLLADAPLVQQTAVTIGAVVHAKIAGALAIDRVTRAVPVEHLVLCASAAGVLGSANQANHAFCSTFLDGLALARRSAGLPAISLDWGVWRGIGSAAALNFDRQAERLGLGSLTAEQGTAWFGRALATAASQLVFLPSVRWRSFAGHFEGGAPALLAEVLTNSRRPWSASAAAPGSAAPVAGVRVDRRAQLASIVARCLGLTGEVDPGTPLNELGLDSLTAVEIKNRAQAELGVTLSVRELIEGASVASLAASAPLDVASTEPPKLQQVTSIVAQVLGLTGAVDAGAPLHELGLDSLMTVEIKNRLASEAGLEVSVRALIEGASIRSIIDASGVPTPGPVGEPARRIIPDPAGRYEPFPLTDMQQAYWLGRRSDLELGSVGCYLYTEFDTDQIDLARAEAAWNRLIRRHDMLRVVILPDGRQQILAEVQDYAFKVMDLRGKPADVELERLRRSLPQRLVEPNSWPLFDIRATLFDGGMRLHMGFDLIALDAASIHALRREWAQLYDDPAAVLPPIGLGFRDYVLEQEAHRASAAWQQSQRYWQARTASLPGGPELPLAGDPARRSRQRFERHRTVIEPDAARALRRQATARGLTLPTLLAAAYVDVLAAWSRTSRFCINVTSFNRPALHEDMAALLGDFTSTILLEVDAQPPTFEARAQGVARQLAGDLEHAEVGGVRVLREMARQKGTAAAFIPVVFTSALGFRRPGTAAVDESAAAGWDRLGTTVYNVSSTPQVLIDQQISEEDDRLFCNWDVAQGLFWPGAVEAMVRAHRLLLAALAEGAGWDRPVAAMVPPQPRAPFVAVAADRLLHAGFERQAATSPRRPALLTPAIELDYGTLDAAADHLAAQLDPRLEDGRRDRLVAVGLAKGWRQIVAVLAVLKTGAAYLPLDPGLPAERRRLLLERGQALLLDDPQAVDAALASARAGRPALRPAVDPDPSRLAYVIYTSGSTGEPKGVMIEHAAAWATVGEVNRRWAVGREDRSFGLSALGFDLSVYDIFGPLAAGGALVLPDAEATRDPAHWSRLLRQHRVTLWNSVPALMAMQLEHGLPVDHALRLIMLSGDWVPIELVAKLRKDAPAAALVALGGATEAAIWSNFHAIGELDPDWPSVPYGTPLDGQMLHVVNARGEPCPDGVTGEIEIAGQGLARGYWRDPAQTAERFRIDRATGERRYRTGDLGRFRSYSTAGRTAPPPIEFLGREDYQVKVQGHRIELGEVEAALAGHPAVAQAVATTLALGAGQAKTLHAFIVPQGASAPGAFDWDELLSTARKAAATHGTAITAEAFEQSAKAFTEQATAAAASAIRRLTGEAALPDAARLIRDHGVAPRYRPWLARMLPQAAGSLPTARPRKSSEIGGVDRLGFDDAAFAFLDRVIEQLPEILTERVHSSAIYLASETPDVYARLFSGPNAVIAGCLEAMAAARPLRVLEVGGGLGTTLAAIEQAVPTDRLSYLFTDVSGHFVRLARARFEGRPWLDFATLDFDLPPSQGSPLFDVVLATSALHVAADIAATLQSLRARLAPGGVLLALEQTRFFPWFDLGMGLQAGFDRRRDVELRPSHPLLARGQWQDQLARAGFHASEIITAEGTLTDRLGFDVLLARSEPVAVAPAADTSLGDKLRAHLQERLPSYMVPLTISAIDQLPLSANGKVDRQALRPPRATAIDAGAPSADRLEREVALTIGALMNQSAIEPERSLFELGATSLTLVAIQRRLAERFGRIVPLQRCFARPTVAGFAAELADTRAVTNPLVTFDVLADGQDDRPKLLLMPGIFSLPFYLRELAAATAGEIAIVSVQFPGLADGEVPIDAIGPQADYAVERLRLARIEPPYLIGGHSFGGRVAIEVARRLRDSGDPTPLLVLGDTVRTVSSFTELQSDELAFIAMTRGLYALYGRSTRVAYEAIRHLPAEVQFHTTARRMQAEGLFGPLELPLDRMVAVFKANFRAVGGFRPSPIPGDMAVIRTEGGFPPEILEYETDEALRDPALGWRDLVQGRMELRTMPGDHLAMLDPANLPVMADLLIELVQGALARHLTEVLGVPAVSLAGLGARDLNRLIRRHQPSLAA